MRYSSDQHQALAGMVLRDGFCVLPRHLPASTLTAWRSQFLPLLAAHIQREGRLKNRGEGRYYVTLPFDTPWADEAVFLDPDVLEVAMRLVGPDLVMCQLATDTPLIGSEYQTTHRDTPPLFPELPVETPPFQLAVNFPLVDVTLENGPMEIARGTHLFHKEEALAKLERGDVRLEPIQMELGDVMIRDVRGLHRGTPNRTDVPRPMVVVGYSRKWLYRPEVSIQVPEQTWQRLSERARQLLRFNPRVADLETAPSTEVYQAYAY